MPATTIATNFPSQLLKKKRWIFHNAKKHPLKLGAKGNRFVLAKSTLESDWSSWEDVSGTVLDTNAGMGFGYVFKKGDGVVGIDLDSAFTEGDNTKLKDWAFNVVSYFNSYTEISPSGTGLHILVLASNGKGKFKECKYKVPAEKGGGVIEIYDTARYFTVTGNVYNPDINTTDDSAKVKNLCAKIFAPAPVSVEATTKVRATTDTDIASTILGSAQHDKYKLLVDGPFEAAVAPYGDDHSAAVYALECIVAFYTDSFEAMDSIMRGSCLFCGDWASKKWARLGESEFSTCRGKCEQKGETWADIDTLAAEALPAAATATETKKVRKGDKEYLRHIALAEAYLGPLSRDLVTDALYYKPHAGKGDMWAAVDTRNVLNALKSACYIAENNKDRKVKAVLYKAPRIEAYLGKYCHEAAKELLLDMPTEWDGKDRIAQMSGAFANGLDWDGNKMPLACFDDILKDWLSKLWGRIMEPQTVQNRCLLISGPQGIGKDMWVKSMLCCLGHYFSDLTLKGKNTQESDIAVVMAASLVMFISEFDKTNVLDVGTLKDLITKDTFTMVRKYDRESSRMANRCSMIAACNPSQVLRDVTGNRRFVVIRLKGAVGKCIDWSAFPLMDHNFSAQILAQAKELWACGYKTMGVTEERIRRVNAEFEVEDAGDEIIREFEQTLDEMIRTDPFSDFLGDDESSKQKLWRLDEIDTAVGLLARNFGKPRNAILNVLKRGGCVYKHKKGHYYSTRGGVRDAAKILKKMKERNWN